MKNRKQEMDFRENEGSQEDLNNQNDEMQNAEYFFNKKGTNDFNESLTENKDENKKKQLYEEENRGIDKQAPKEIIKNTDVDESASESNSK